MFKRMLALLSVIAIIAIIGVGCSRQNPTEPMGDTSGETLLKDNAGLDGSDNVDMIDNSTARLYYRGKREPVTFMVRIENVSTGSTLMLSNGETAPAPHSPGVWTITHLLNPLFKVGRFDMGLGLEAQAEDGDPTMLAMSMEDNHQVISSGVFNTPVGDAGPGPATPGKAYEFEITAMPGDHFSFTSMFGQSNDLFYAPGWFGIPLFDRWGAPVNGDVTSYIKLWDAGTEVNQEPGLGADQAPRQSAPNTGESEHKRIWPVHDQFTYPPTNEVIKVTITPVSDAT